MCEEIVGQRDGVAGPMSAVSIGRAVIPTQGSLALHNLASVWKHWAPGPHVRQGSYQGALLVHHYLSKEVVYKSADTGAMLNRKRTSIRGVKMILVRRNFPHSKHVIFASRHNKWEKFVFLGLLEVAFCPSLSCRECHDHGVYFCSFLLETYWSHF